MNARGFTLLELLLALTLFAVLSMLAYGGLASVLDARESVGVHAERLGDLQRAVAHLVDDLQQVADRPIRDTFGDVRPAFEGRADGAQSIELTRGGWPNPAGHPRSSLLRIGYLLEDGTLVRRVWTELDRAPDSVPVEQRLLDRVTSLEIRFLEVRGGRWSSGWPPESSSPDDAPLPMAIAVELEVEDFGRVRRQVVLDG